MRVFQFVICANELTIRYLSTDGNSTSSTFGRSPERDMHNMDLSQQLNTWTFGPATSLLIAGVFFSKALDS